MIIFIVLVVALMSSQATHVAASGFDFMVNTIILPMSTSQFKTQIKPLTRTFTNTKPLAAQDLDV